LITGGKSKINLYLIKTRRSHCLNELWVKLLSCCNVKSRRFFLHQRKHWSSLPKHP